MPELPEVKTVVKLLNAAVKNQIIKNIIVNLPKLIKNQSEKMFIKKLIGKTINSVENKGKFIIFKLSDEIVLISHLRMEGKYRISAEQKFGKHDHIIFDLGQNYLIYNDTRQFGTFHIFNNDQYIDVAPLNKLASEPKDTNSYNFYQKIRKKSIPIKSTLLDQSLIVGLGNIYVNEVLWWEKTDPRKPTNTINENELKKIIKRATIVLEEATKLGGTTIHSFKSFGDEQGNYQTELKVHGREHKKCYRCQMPINKIKVGGRGTYFCPRCQN